MLLDMVVVFRFVVRRAVVVGVVVRSFVALFYISTPKQRSRIILMGRHDCDHMQSASKSNKQKWET